MKRPIGLSSGLLAALLVLAAVAADAPAVKRIAKADPVPVQIRANTIFFVPLTDGTQAPARCENIEGKARLTIVGGGAFVDFQITAWGTGPTPPIPPTPTPPMPPPTPPVPPTPPPTPPPTIVAALVVITETPTASGSWTTPAVGKILAGAGITAYNYAISSVSDPNYADLIGLKWIGKSAGNATPYVFLADAAGNVKWEGAAPTTDAGWATLLGKYPATRRGFP